MNGTEYTEAEAALRQASALTKKVVALLEKGHQRCGCGCPRCEHQVYKNPGEARIWNTIKGISGRLAGAADTLVAIVEAQVKEEQ